MKDDAHEMHVTLNIATSFLFCLLVLFSNYVLSLLNWQSESTWTKKPLRQKDLFCFTGRIRHCEPWVHGCIPHFQQEMVKAVRKSQVTFKHLCPVWQFDRVLWSRCYAFGEPNEHKIEFLSQLCTFTCSICSINLLYRTHDAPYIQNGVSGMSIRKCTNRKIII